MAIVLREFVKLITQIVVTTLAVLIASILIVYVLQRYHLLPGMRY